MRDAAKLTSDSGDAREVLVVGAGVIGSSVAYHCARRGLEVLLVDREGVGAGTSSTSGGSVSLFDKEPGSLFALAHESARRFRDLDRELEHDIGFVPCGGLVPVLDAKSKATADKRARLLAQQGLVVEWLDMPEARRLYPFLSSAIVGVYRIPEEGRVRPKDLAIGYAHAAVRLGAEISLGESVQAITIDGRSVRKVKTSRRVLHPRRLVWACGPHSAELKDAVGIEIPVRPRRGHIVALNGSSAPRIPCVIHGASYLLAKPVRSAKQVAVAFAFEPRGDVYRVGSSREFVGFESIPSSSIVESLMEEAVQYVPDLKDCPILETIVCFRPASPDGFPIVGPTECENLFVATGHEGDGICMAPVTGDAISRLISSECVERDRRWDCMRPTRFGQGDQLEA